MLKSLPKKHLTGGQMLIGVLIAISIFLILTHALFTLISASFELVSFNKARITARHLAQEKIETIKNLSYSDVGTVGGIPQGIISQEENISKNGLNYVIKTHIIYIDDPFDYLAPTDTAPEDYKRISVEASWEGIGRSGKNPLTLVTDISANATGNTDGGNLVILAYNANSQPVSQAEVTITAASLDPPVNLTLFTDTNGKIVLPGAPPCISCYRIAVTKTGFSTDRTYSTSEVTNPIKPDTSVFTDQVTQLSFAIDTLSNLNLSSLNSRENNFTPLGDINFRIRGNKIIGTDAYAQPVYKYDKTFFTDGSGSKILSNIEWDVYRILMPSGTSYDISGTSPLLPLYLNPGGNVIFKFSVAPHSTHSLLLTVKDPSQNLIASASGSLILNGFNQPYITGQNSDPDSGQALLSGLAEGSYTLTASASGFTDFNGGFDISGYTVGDVVLTQQ